MADSTDNYSGETLRRQKRVDCLVSSREISQLLMQAELNEPLGLSAYIPRHVLQEIQDSLSAALNVPLLFTSWDGLPITRSSVLSTFCYRFTHKSGVKRPCANCERFSTVNDPEGSLTRKALVPKSNDCPVGMLDVAIPIVLGNRVAGYIVTSQLIDDEATRKKAYEMMIQSGMDEDKAQRFLDQFPGVAADNHEKVARAIGSIVTLVTGLARSYALNARLAIRDALTGLFNRAYLWEFLSKKIEEYRNTDKGLAIVIFDLNNFKQINDFYGHRAGDEVLVNVAKTLTDCTRSGDLPARFGGDEFVVVLDDVNQEGAELVAARISKAIADRDIPYDDEVLKITASVGIGYFSPESISSVEEIFNAADKHLYQAKSLLKKAS